MDDVESLSDVAFQAETDVPQNEEFGSVASLLVAKRTVEIDAMLLPVNWPDSPSGEPWEERDLPKLLPRLISAKIATRARAGIGEAEGESWGPVNY